MSIAYHREDLPRDVDLGDIIAIDTETMGLDPARDRLCVVQMSAGDGHCHVVHFSGQRYDAPNLKRLLSNPDTLKLFHFARFDLAILKRYLGVTCRPVYCTKIASKIARTYTDRHGLKGCSVSIFPSRCKALIGEHLSSAKPSLLMHPMMFFISMACANAWRSCSSGKSGII